MKDKHPDMPRPRAHAANGEPKRSAAEKRRASRQRHGRSIRIYPCVGPRQLKPIRVFLQDFSSVGMGFTHTHLLNPNQQFILHLGTADGHRVALLYTVVHCRPIYQNLYFIGAEFTCRVGSPAMPPEQAYESLKRLKAAVLA